jgi:type VI secretion system protein VasI
MRKHKAFYVAVICILCSLGTYADDSKKKYGVCLRAADYDESLCADEKAAYLGKHFPSFAAENNRARIAADIAAKEEARIAELDEKYKAAVASNSSNSMGKWRARSKADPITDIVIASLTLTAESGTSRLGEPVTLHLRCDDSKTEAYINWNSYMTDSAQVTTRVDKNTPQKTEWQSDTSKTVSFYPRLPHPELDAQLFVKELTTGTTLIARATPYNEAPITAVWDLTGIMSATKDLRSSCGF